MFYFLSRTGKRSQLERDFFEKIIEVVDYDHCILTVRSSLWDFPLLEEPEQILAKVKEVYGVDISDLGDGNLNQIFRRIFKKWKTANR